jgi:hypothetical protein
VATETKTLPSRIITKPDDPLTLETPQCEKGIGQVILSPVAAAFRSAKLRPPPPGIRRQSDYWGMRRDRLSNPIFAGRAMPGRLRRKLLKRRVFHCEAARFRRGRAGAELHHMMKSY